MVYETIIAGSNPAGGTHERQALTSEVASLLEQGYNGRMIANELNISESYVSQLRKEIV